MNNIILLCNYVYHYIFSVSLTSRDSTIQTISTVKSLIEVTDSLEKTLFPHFFPIFLPRSTRHGSTRECRIRRFVWQRIKLLYKNVKGFASANRFRELRGSEVRSRMWARLVRWNWRIANAIGSLIVSKRRGEGVRRVETWDPTREFKASRKNSGREEE